MNTPVNSGAGLLNIHEAAQRLHCSPKTVRRLVRGGRLACVRLTKTRTEPLRFRAVDVARLIEASVEGGVAGHDNVPTP